MGGTYIRKINRKIRYFDIGFEYYLSGRHAYFCCSTNMCGNLFHHAVEMILKSDFANELNDSSLKRIYGHNLIKIWNSFSKKYKSNNLERFNKFIEELSLWKDIRYPPSRKDYLILSVATKKEKSQQIEAYKGSELRKISAYIVCLEEVDEFMMEIINLFNISKEGLLKEFFSKGDISFSTYKRNNLHMIKFHKHSN